MHKRKAFYFLTAGLNGSENEDERRRERESEKTMRKKKCMCISCAKSERCTQMNEKKVKNTRNINDSHKANKKKFSFI